VLGFFWDGLSQTTCLCCFEPWASWSLPLEELGLQAWAKLAVVSTMLMSPLSPWIIFLHFFPSTFIECCVRLWGFFRE
jgi:hypothetical protein